MKLANALKPILHLLPEIPLPDRRQPFDERAQTTILCVIIYCVMSQLPLYGIQSATADPFYHQRLMLGSSRGTLMELGVGHILTAGMLMQILAAAKVFEINHNLKEDRMAFQGMQKLAGVMLALFQSVFFVLAGIYGPVSSLGMFKSILIMMQLFGSSCIVILLDELLQKGYGIGSGVSLFTCCSICSDVIWKGIAPISFTSSSIETTTADGTVEIVKQSEFYGALVAMIHLPITRDNKLQAILDALFLRHGMAVCSVFAIVVTVAVGAAVAYFQTWRVEVLVKYQKFRAQQGKYPIKLFYTSNIPLVMYATIAGNIFMVSQVVYSAFPNSPLCIITGKWAHVGDIEGVVVPTAGLPYYISPPDSLLDIIFDPFHVMFYAVFVVCMAATFAKIWVEVSGKGPKGVARELKEQQMIIKGHRDTALEHELNRYIPVAAALGGVCVGVLSFIADLLGSAVSGPCVIVAVTVIFQYYEIILRDSGGMLKNLIGE
mmetsp:Transcript_6485/g.9774  ORF Transcript_6485/g.9774 Transcript_6485/m.9774 type:complete len:490 (+) Transcript_6485:77-1546(+)|eukprot:CAMPEP_0185024032 /NCGR_PEP_ID=MMETSP1103-20130426/6917_1 /TAXON_ID=36769 /ORGANISM="Paraphysomonas bandaiensis, Strain Caron Lab Isolate" /LENGTH=489 /DNA_ID=CAMNT_0027556875 /DNA_START=71 /DNA_END=1540 /DNA_ORIENTATION=-